jgi:hypothetical protein
LVVLRSSDMVGLRDGCWSLQVGASTWIIASEVPRSSGGLRGIDSRP